MRGSVWGAEAGSYLIPCDGADMAPGHLPAHPEGCAVERLQLDVQGGAEPLCV